MGCRCPAHPDGPQLTMVQLLVVRPDSGVQVMRVQWKPHAEFWILILPTLARCGVTLWPVAGQWQGHGSGSAPGPRG